ncbi:MAG: hypothetical protein JST82_16615 [Bacteroidetes bacterium]|nr:hypothetical protein [Bacteroidota bacterium]
MRKYIVTILVIAVGLLPALNTYAQPSVQDIEQKLADHMKHIQYWRFEYSPDDTSFAGNVNPDDSLAAANKSLLTYLQDICTRQPATLQAIFKSLDGTDLKIVTSDDKKFRIYCWDSQTGNSNTHNYNIIAQYETNAGTKTQVLNDVSHIVGDGPEPGVSYTSILSIDASRKKYYMPVYNGIQTGITTKGISAYYIDNQKLADAVIFYGPFDNTSKLEYHYDYAANYDFKKMKEEITVHLDKQKLYLPVAENNKLTGKWMVYVYDGEKFVYNKDEK